MRISASKAITISSVVFALSCASQAYASSSQGSGYEAINAYNDRMEGLLKEAAVVNQEATKESVEYVNANFVDIVQKYLGDNTIDYVNSLPEDSRRRIKESVNTITQGLFEDIDKLSSYSKLSSRITHSKISPKWEMNMENTVFDGLKTFSTILNRKLINTAEVVQEDKASENKLDRRSFPSMITSHLAHADIEMQNLANDDGDYFRIDDDDDDLEQGNSEYHITQEYPDGFFEIPLEQSEVVNIAPEDSISNQNDEFPSADAATALVQPLRRTNRSYGTFRTVVERRERILSILKEILILAVGIAEIEVFFLVAMTNFSLKAIFFQIVFLVVYKKIFEQTSVAYSMGMAG